MLLLTEARFFIVVKVYNCFRLEDFRRSGFRSVNELAGFVGGSRRWLFSVVMGFGVVLLLVLLFVVWRLFL